MNSQSIEFYTDGACSGNPGNGGWAFVQVNPDNDKVFYSLGGFKKETTNNEMELKAFLECLRYISNKNINGNIVIYTDSKYVCDGINRWLSKWKDSNWRTSTKQPVKNRSLWQAIDVAFQDVKVSVKWVEGHGDNKYNDIVDKLAVKQYVDYQNEKIKTAEKFTSICDLINKLVIEDNLAVKLKIKGVTDKKYIEPLADLVDFILSGDCKSDEDLYLMVEGNKVQFPIEDYFVIVYGFK